MNVTDQLDLFARPSDPDTSYEAGETIRPYVSGMRLQILEQLATTSQGFTAAELAERFTTAWGRPVQQNSIARRLTTLRGQGYASVDGTRPGHTGRACTVWVISRAGREVLGR